MLFPWLLLALQVAGAQDASPPSPPPPVRLARDEQGAVRWDGRDPVGEYRGIHAKVVVDGVSADSVLVLIASITNSSYVRRNPSSAPLREAHPAQNSPVFMVAAQPATDVHADFDAGGRVEPPKGPPFVVNALVLRMPVGAASEAAIRHLDEQSDAIAAALAGGTVEQARSLARNADVGDGETPLGASGLLATWQLGYRAAQAFVPDVAARAFARGRAMLATCVPADHFSLIALDLDAAFHLSQAGHRSEARDWFADAVSRAGRTLTPDDPTRELAESSLANNCLTVSDCSAALALLEPLHERQAGRLDPHDSVLRVTRTLLADALVRSNRIDDGLHLDEQVLREIESDGLATASARAMVQLNYALHRSRAGDWRGAADLARGALHRMAGADVDAWLGMESRQRAAHIFQGAGATEEARALFAEIFDESRRVLPETDPRRLDVMNDYAGFLHFIGDVESARTIFEHVVEIASRILPDEHPMLQTARSNLADSLASIGQVAEAAALARRVVEVYEASRAEDDVDLLDARFRFARIGIQDLRVRVQVLKQLVDVASSKLPASDSLVFNLRDAYASTLVRLGLAKQAQEVLELQLAAVSGDEEAESDIRRVLLLALATAGDRPAIVTHATLLATSTIRAIRELSQRAESRRVEQFVLARQSVVDQLFDLTLGSKDLAPFPELADVAFEAAEELRDAPFSQARLARGSATAAATPSIAALRMQLSDASRRVAEAAQHADGAMTLLNALRTRDTLEKTLREKTAAPAGSIAAGPRLDPSVLRASIPEATAVVAFRAQEVWSLVPPLDFTAIHETLSARPKLLACIVRRERPTTVLDLGPIDRIESAVARWRTGVDAEAARGAKAVEPTLSLEELATETRAAGLELEAQVVEPIRAALEGVRDWIVVLDTPLFVLPLDALPKDEALVGDEIAIHVVPSLGAMASAPIGPSRGAVTLVGGVAYGKAAGEPTLAMLRSTPFGDGFVPLPATLREVQEIERVARSSPDLEKDEVRLVASAEASRQTLVRAAPTTRFLHLATHGFYAPESIPSTIDDRFMDAGLQIGAFAPQREKVSALSPMVLCGLALAGANDPPDAEGHVNGLITAEEIAAFDLSHCELAVLSACETALGWRGANRSVASLQKALHMAGARTAITSLWKVPDEATKELMVDFYRRLWIEKKPKHQAMWESKKRLRDWKNADGTPKYGLRDWAAWVLTGDPK
jgi:CHAT domain-containing protein/tetratricopeptide (TPR) repeat protein